MPITKLRQLGLLKFSCAPLWRFSMPSLVSCDLLILRVIFIHNFKGPIMKKLIYILIPMVLLLVTCKKSPTEPKNYEPIASFIVAPTSGSIDTIFNFDANGSSDREDTTLEL